MTDINKKDRPRERMFEIGATALTDAELLSIILRSGTKDSSAINLSYKILKEFGGLKPLIDTSLEQLMGFGGVGVAKASGIKAVCEISMRMHLGLSGSRVVVSTPQDVFSLIRKELYSKKKEHLYLLSLDSQNSLISKDLISVGTVNETLVHPREVFRTAILKNAVSIILVHNHPSQNSSPSSQDLNITEKIAKVGITLGIALVDHVIVTDSAYKSMKQLGLFTVHNFREGG